MNIDKRIHSLVLDAGPIIKNEPAVSTLLKQAEQLFTVPAIISEIKDSNTRSRVQTTLQPFLSIRSPAPSSIKHVTDFARKTGDLAVLSRPDIEIIALTYELECERNQGNWRLRSTPGQQRLNGAPPTSVSESNAQSPKLQDDFITPETGSLASKDAVQQDVADQAEHPSDERFRHAEDQTKSEVADQDLSLRALQLSDDKLIPGVAEPLDVSQEESESASDSEGWITPTTLKRHQARDQDGSTDDVLEQAVMQAAVITSDFAMQNVILQMNLNLISSSLQRVKHLKTFILRCHACFSTTKDMSKQFCPRCGQPTLTRVACSTNARGEFKLHLKKNMQWNTRGDRYSVPKPAHGSANGRVKGGGQNGWGHDLILTEDQKEYERARTAERKQKERSLMDEDYLPSILTGARSQGSGRIKVGAGKNVNSRRR